MDVGALGRPPRASECSRVITTRLHQDYTVYTRGDISRLRGGARRDQRDIFQQGNPPGTACSEPARDRMHATTLLRLAAS